MKRTMLTACLAIFAAPALAPAAPEPQPPTSEIEPEARDLLNRMGARYKVVRSYSDVTTLSVSPTDAFGAGKNGKEADPGDEYNFRARVAWEKPNKARIEKFGTHGRAYSSSDGKMMRAYNPLHPSRFLERAANFNSINDAMNEIGVGAPGLGHLAGQGIRFFQGALSSLQLGPDSRADGVATHQIIARLAFPSGGSAVETLEIGIKDGLLRRVTQKYSGEGTGKAATIVETHSQIKIDPSLPASTFAFAPPRGARRIDYYSRLSPDGGKPRVKENEALPAFEALDMDGQKVKLEDFRGRALLIHFFATWEATSGDVAPVVRLFKRLHGRGLSVVGVPLDARREQVARFVAREKMPYPVLFDGRGWSNAVAKQYGVRSLPTTLLVGRDGKLRRVLGRAEEAGFDEAVEAALRQK